MAAQATRIAEGDEDAELGGLPAAGFHEVDLFGGHEGAEIADCSVDEGGEEKPADGSERDDERGRVRNERDDGEDEDELNEGEEEAGDVFCEEDVAHAGGAEEVELDAGAVDSEGVVGEDGDAEDGVGDGDGKDEVAVAAAEADAAGEEKDHEEGRDEAVELVEIAAEVDELFLQAGDDGGVEAEGAGAVASCGAETCDGVRDCGWGSARGGLVGLSDFAEVFAAELAMHAPGVDGEEESGEGDEAEERGDGGEDVALAGAGRWRRR